MFTLGSPIFRCSYCGSSRIKTCANACDHGLWFKSLSRATPCISSLKRRIFSPVVENQNIGRAVSLFCYHIGEEYFYWLIKNNQPMRIFLARSSCCCYVNIQIRATAIHVKINVWEYMTSFLSTKTCYVVGRPLPQVRVLTSEPT